VCGVLCVACCVLCVVCCVLGIRLGRMVGGFSRYVRVFEVCEPNCCVLRVVFD